MTGHRFATLFWEVYDRPVGEDPVERFDRFPWSRLFHQIVQPGSQNLMLDLDSFHGPGMRTAMYILRAHVLNRLRLVRRSRVLHGPIEGLLNDDHAFGGKIEDELLGLRCFGKGGSKLPHLL